MSNGNSGIQNALGLLVGLGRLKMFETQREIMEEREKERKQALDEQQAFLSEEAIRLGSTQPAPETLPITPIIDPSTGFARTPEDFAFTDLAKVAEAERANVPRQQFVQGHLTPQQFGVLTGGITPGDVERAGRISLGVEQTAEAAGKFALGQQQLVVSAFNVALQSGDVKFSADLAEAKDVGDVLASIKKLGFTPGDIQLRGQTLEAATRQAMADSTSRAANLQALAQIAAETGDQRIEALKAVMDFNNKLIDNTLKNIEQLSDVAPDQVRAALETLLGAFQQQENINATLGNREARQITPDPESGVFGRDLGFRFPPIGGLPGEIGDMFAEQLAAGVANPIIQLPDLEGVGLGAGSPLRELIFPTSPAFESGGAGGAATAPTGASPSFGVSAREPAFAAGDPALPLDVDTSTEAPKFKGGRIPLGTALQDPNPFDAQIEAAAIAADLPPALFRSLVFNESAFRPNAVSPTGARGLAQLMPDTFGEVMPNGDLDDPADNLMAGALYLRQMLDRFNGDERLAIAAYNWGPGAVNRHLRQGKDISTMPKETQNHVARVMGGKFLLSDEVPTDTPVIAGIESERTRASKMRPQGPRSRERLGRLREGLPLSTGRVIGGQPRLQPQPSRTDAGNEALWDAFFSNSIIPALESQGGANVPALLREWARLTGSQKAELGVLLLQQLQGQVQAPGPLNLGLTESITATPR